MSVWVLLKLRGACMGEASARALRSTAPVVSVPPVTTVVAPGLGCYAGFCQITYFSASLHPTAPGDFEPGHRSRELFSFSNNVPRAVAFVTLLNDSKCLGMILAREAISFKARSHVRLPAARHEREFALDANSARVLEPTIIWSLTVENCCSRKSKAALDHYCCALNPAHYIRPSCSRCNN